MNQLSNSTSTPRFPARSAHPFVIRHSSFVISLLLASPVFAADTPSYEKHIAPILRTYCSGCHNDKELEGGLSVETFVQLKKGGDDHAEPVTPGDAAKSFLIQVIEGSAKPKMPPKDEPQVPAEELATLKRWVADGAAGPTKDVSILKTLEVPSLPASSKAKPVTAASFSPDGKTLALARHGEIELRDAAANAVRQTISGLPGKVCAVHFSPDGKTLALASGITGLTGVAQIRNVADGALVREFGGHGDLLYDAEFSPDGKTLATAGYDRVIRLWNVADGRELRAIDVHKGAVFDLAFDPSGRVLASASADETVKLWRVADGERLDTLNAPQGEQVAVIFSPDGRNVIAAGADKRIHLWRLISKDKPALNPLVHSRFAHETPIVGLALSGDGKSLVSTASDRTTKLWSLPDLELLHTCELQPDVTPVLAAVPGSARMFAARMDGSTGEIALTADKPQPLPALGPESSPADAAEKKPAIFTEAEPNNTPQQAMPVTVPAEIKGAISSAGGHDLFRFTARRGDALMLEVNAARAKSPIDSRIEVLTADGQPVEQVVLQATRDSWLTFRGKDSDTSDDFRVHNWEQMELNEYLYVNGEVVRLWLYPRGPDSGFKVYPGEGKRRPEFATTSLSHALGQPAYIVRPLPPGSQPAPNGLPVFRLSYVNDDDPSRRAGADSVLRFVAPADGEYLARISDVRGFGGDDFRYTLAVRPCRPDFKVSIAEGRDAKVSPGSGRELRFKIERFDGFDGPVRVAVENLPPGFSSSLPLEIEAGQSNAEATLHAAADAAAPDDAADKAVKITASAQVAGREVRHELGTLGNLQLDAAPKLAVEILPGDDRSVVKETPGAPLEFTIRPGQTITAKVRATRHDFAGRIELGKEDAGRNLPHGLFVDNIGLNGLLIVEGQTERDFVITAAPMARPGTRFFHLKASADGGQVSRPALIRVIEPAAPATAGR